MVDGDPWQLCLGFPLTGKVPIADLLVLKTLGRLAVRVPARGSCAGMGYFLGVLNPVHVAPDTR